MDRLDCPSQPQIFKGSVHCPPVSYTRWLYSGLDSWLAAQPCLGLPWCINRLVLGKCECTCNRFHPVGSSSLEKSSQHRLQNTLPSHSS